MKALYKIILITVLGAATVSGCLTRVTHKGDGMVGYPDSSLAGTDDPKRYALVIGINSFEDPTWHNLRFATNDAHKVAQAFEEFDQVKLLTQAGQLTRENILKELDYMIGQAQLEKDTILVYISSHGTLGYSLAGRLERYVVLEDTQSNSIPKSALSVRELLSRLEGARSRRRAAIFAFCHSGEGKSRLGKKIQEQVRSTKASYLVDPLDEVSEATIVLSASAWGETAREDAKLEHDVYTYFMLEGINKGDRNKDGAVSLTETHDYARQRTYYYTNGSQRPGANSKVVGIDPIILRGFRSRPGLPEIKADHPSISGFDIWVDGQKKGTSPTTIAVEPGTRLVQIKDADQKEPLIESLVELTRDQIVEAWDLLPPQPEIIFGAGVGAMRMFSSNDAFPGLLANLGLFSRLTNWPSGGYWLELSFDGAYGESRFVNDRLKTQTSIFRLGGSFGWQWQTGNFRLWLGPSLGVFWVNRSFPEIDLDSELSMGPWGGLMLGVDYIGFSLGQLGLNLRGAYLPVKQDDIVDHHGIIEALLVFRYSSYL
jgi:hypothetical protein